MNTIANIVITKYFASCENLICCGVVRSARGLRAHLATECLLQANSVVICAR